VAKQDPNITPIRDVEPPGTWSAGRRLARRAFAPIERFLQIEAASGIVLLVAAAAALIWANSSAAHSYEALWHTNLSVSLGPWTFARPLHFWINDVLMTVFFFVVGLEIRREIAHGELSELRRAALPLAAALGGMIAPACIFAVLNRGATAQGWGIPMATDIAFAVGVLALLGKRVPPALRVLLLALAVIDDVGSILVIAVFYSSGISAEGFLVLVAGVATIILLQRLGVRPVAAYLLPGAAVWVGAYSAGIHPTLAGVVVGLLTPVAAGIDRERFLKSAEARLQSLWTKKDEPEQQLLHDLDELNQGRREVVSPVERLQHALHGYVAFGIMPLFALANAGVALGAVSLKNDELSVFLGVTLGLVLGKPLGVLIVSFLCVKLGLASLPRGVSWGQTSVVGVVAGIGFTMAIFIAQLAFPGGGSVLEAAKLGILAASGFAAVAGLVLGRLVLPKQVAAEAAQTVAEAESSTAS
jgi:Na+:H+ antiporter, NhaA family